MDQSAILKLWMERKEKWVPPQPTNFQISTCTLNGKLHRPFSLSSFVQYILNNVPRSKYQTHTDSSYKIQFNDFEKSDTIDCEHGSLNSCILWNLDKISATSEDTPAGSDAHKTIPNYFYNSISIIVEMKKPNEKGQKKFINCKYFKNGSITLTGCRNLEDGNHTIDIVWQWMCSHPEWFPDGNPTELEIRQFASSPLIFRTMNAYFSIEFSVDLFQVYRLFTDKIKHLFCCYEPTEYQGLVLYYLWNKKSPVKDGSCQCDKPCMIMDKGRRKTPQRPDECIKITFIIFSTGKALMAGATTLEQVTEVYQYFTGLFQKYGKEVVQLCLEQLVPESVQKDKPKTKGKRVRNSRTSTPTVLSGSTPVLSERVDSPVELKPAPKRWEPVRTVMSYWNDETH